MNGINGEYTHRTRKGNRIYRQPKTNGGKIVGRSKNFLYKVKRNGRQHYFPVGTAKREAGRLADKVADYLKAPDATPEKALQRYFPALYEQKYGRDPSDAIEPTVGDLIEAYRENYTRDRLRTKTETIQAIRRISCFVLGMDELPRKGRTREVLLQRNRDSHKLPVKRITPQKLNAFKANLLRKAGTNETAKGRARTTCNAYLRNAGQLFAPRVVKACYDGFALPPNPFLEVEREEEPRHLYESSVDPIELINKARKELKDNDSDAYAAFLMALFAGLSNSEMDKLLWDQVDLEKGSITIKETEYYRPKRRSRTERVWLPESVKAEIASYRDERKAVPLYGPDFVLPGYNASAKKRCDPIFRRLSGWLRAKGVKGTKTIHALRKEGGSAIYQQTGSIDLAAQFLRNDPKTAREHYVDMGESLVVDFGGER